MDGQLLALPDCVIPGCRNPVEDHGVACTACVSAFGPYLQIAPGAGRLTTEQISERDTYVRSAYAAQRRLP